MSAIASGLIGGAIAVALTNYIAKRVGKSGESGKLYFGPFLWGLAIASLGMALLPAIALYADHQREFWAKAGLIVGLGAGAIYCFAEAAFVRGTFDSEEIRFSTPWTGQKHEQWRDLESVQLNHWTSWYTLKFRSGTKIRLSRYLSGHLSALEVAHARVP